MASTEPTPQLTERIVRHLLGGLHMAVACRLEGVQRKQFREWWKRGKAEPNSACGRFRSACRKADQLCEARLVAGLVKASATDPRIAQWILSRRAPERWGESVLDLAKIRKQIRELENDLGDDGGE